MPVRLHHIVVDAHDLPGLARFWTQPLGWKVLSERENEIVIRTDENAPAGRCFMPVTDPKTVKNRVHLDLTSSAADRDQEIDRLLALGARRAGIGQTGAEFWTVLADPEGNEFCVVRPKVKTRSGTPPYQPPDANLARWDVSPDLFAVGVVLYQLLCDGHHPYPDKTPMVDEPVIDPRTIHSDLNPELAEFLAKACASANSDRFPTAVEMQLALHKVRADL
jgi:serine/threonine protein kinase